MKKTNNTTVNAQAIVFAQASDNAKAVVADRYVIHALYTQNKALVESLGGTLVKGVGGFRAEFKTVANAKKFVATAITHIDADEYAKARKTEPKAKAEPKAKKVAPTTAKGTKKAEFITLTDAEGNTFKVPTSVLESTKAPKKSKGKVEEAKPTTAPNAKAKKAEKVATPKKAKGNCAVDFSALAGKGKAANKEAAALMRAAGYTNGTTAEYKAVWAEWCKVR